MQLTDEQREFLREPHFAVVATIGADGMPHQTVMWYQLTDDGVLLNTPDGSLKAKHLQHDNRISICVERGYQFVTLIGTVELETDGEKSKADYAAMGMHYRDTFAARPIRPPKGGFPPMERMSIYVKVDKVVSMGF